MPEEYQRVSARDHVLLRPDTYVGSTEVVEWTNTNLATRLAVVPALYKIFDEVLVNAGDNITTGKTTSIEVNITDQGFTVENDGTCVPVVKHKEEKIWTPELVFGHLRTSSNYNDKQERLTGGRNGYGAKLANIFAREFKVSIDDPRKKKCYGQTWTNNMGTVHPPRVTKYEGKTSRTTVCCIVDLAKFGLDRIPEATMAMMERRVHDLKVCNPSVQVRLNGEELTLRPTEYVNSYMSDIVFRQENKRWQLVVGINHDTGEFQQQSFVNGIWTRNGGTHVEYIWKQMHKQLEPILTRFKLKPYEVKRKLSLFLSCKLVNPTFDSQIKETCTLPVAKFGSEFHVQKAFLVAVKSSALMDILEAMVTKKDAKKLKKNDGKKRSSVNVPKLTDATHAGGPKSSQCTLILSEGDSANALALAGMGEVGSQLYGAYPLKGKILNGFTAGIEKWSKNAVIADVIRCLGLQHGKKYTDVKHLRYGSVLIMADQDTDGFHIRGLVFSIFGSHWPELLRIPGFIRVMKTPLVKAFQGQRLVQEFFNEELAHNYIEQHPALRYKFYKGLGTSTGTEAKAMFRNLKKYTFPMAGAPDCLQRAFTNDDFARKWRKEIVTRPPAYTTDDRDGRTYDSYVNGPWVEQARASNERSIADVHDGLKPVQRKILYTLIRRGNNNEIKVAQLSGKVALDTHYHHGETNVGNAGVNMAQDFVGSNNLPYLQPIGQFGTVHKGGADHASHRYIFTKLQAWVLWAFPAADLPVLDFNNVDGHEVEPHHFVPIIPTILVNGVSGIGNGWATDIPKYNPVDIIDYLLQQTEAAIAFKPWYRGFTGDVVETDDGGYTTVATTTRSGSTLVVTELPVGVWTSDVKEKLNKLGLNYTEEHTDTTVKFTIHDVDEPTLSKLPFLTQKIKQNWVVFENDTIRKTSLEDILAVHTRERLKLYTKRKEFQLAQFQDKMTEKGRRMAFILFYLAGRVPLTSEPYPDCVAACRAAGIDPTYLDTLRLRDMTSDAVERLQAEITTLKESHDRLLHTAERDMWMNELKDLRQHLVGETKKRKRDDDE